MQPIMGLIFDLDGTLVDSGPDLVTAVNLTLAELGLAPMAKEQVSAYLGHGPGRLIRDALGPEYHDLADRAYPIFQRHYQEHLVEGTHCYEGIRQLLETWRPRVAMGIVTNKDQGWTEEILLRLGMASFFDPVFGYEALPVHKPHPGPLLEMAARWGLAPGNTVMIGDSEMDILAGRAASAITCGVTWGNRSEYQIRALEPDFVVSRTEALSDVFETVQKALEAIAAKENS